MTWCMESAGRHCKASSVCDHEQSKRSFPYGIPLRVLRHRAVSSPAHEDAKLLSAWLCRGGMLCGIRSQPLWDLDQVVRIEHRCWSLCCFERVRSVRVFRDRLSGGWASGNWGRNLDETYDFEPNCGHYFQDWYWMGLLDQMRPAVPSNLQKS